MPNLSWMEMLVVGIVALVVIGPKDLPGMFRQVGQFVGKAKGMAREFSSAMNAAADEAGVKDINKTLKAAANPQKFGVDKIREATKMQGGSMPDPDAKPENETDKLRAKMTDERKATAKKMSDAMAKAANERVAAEKAAEAATKAPAGTVKDAPKTAKTATSASKSKAPAKAGTKKAPAKKAATKAKAKPTTSAKTAKPKAAKASKDAK
ncbi:Sec-independent protein translocase protein TatB [Octadecabacter sp. CECT 8868]|uniref:Sec-independent protein translocase protein TatB n=1 Tax=Octadecabacter algicola TaxID=2909342 RepID=UPI001F2B3C13|nr:Sec-independent protein translocase protein TatB [Octadecabacter algicola]MCF2903459.1 Sec-independent protein translocase protein TatB [Octadecabacter algicola]